MCAGETIRLRSGDAEPLRALTWMHREGRRATIGLKKRTVRKYAAREEEIKEMERLHLEEYTERGREREREYWKGWNGEWKERIGQQREIKGAREAIDGCAGEGGRKVLQTVE